MLEIKTENEEVLRESVKSALKKTNLIIIAVVLGILLLIILFSFVDFGNLFRGQIGQEPPAEENTQQQTQTTPAPQFNTTVVDSEVTFANSELLNFSYIIDQSGFVTFRIFDQENNEVHTFSQTNVPANELTATTWNGQLENGTILSAGSYTYVIIPENATGTGQGQSGSFRVIAAQAPAEIIPLQVQPQPEEPEQQEDFEDTSVTQLAALTSSDADFENANNSQEPPSLQGPATADSTETVTIMEHGIFPLSFNPNLNETQLTYKISADAVIEIQILDSRGRTILTLIDDQDLNQGEHSVWWNGRNSLNNNMGNIVAPGTYRYQINAKNFSGEITDTASGDVRVVYTQVADFEEDIATPQTTSNEILVLQNTTTGTTAQTGPSALIYLLLPLSGYLLTRRKKLNN